MIKHDLRLLRSAALRASAAHLVIMVPILLTTSCAIWPVADHKVDTTSDLMKAGRDHESVQIANATDAHHLVDGLYAVTSDQSRWRMIFENTTNDATFYGTLLAVIGVATDGIAARNFGAGVAGLASATGGHYQFSQQRVAFDRANGRARCLQQALNGITDEDLDLFDGHALPKWQVEGKEVDAAMVWAAFPSKARSSVDAIILALKSDLTQLSTPTGSLEDLQAITLKLKTAADQAAATPPGAATSSTAQAAVTAADSLAEKTQYNLAALQSNQAEKVVAIAPGAKSGGTALLRAAIRFDAGIKTTTSATSQAQLDEADQLARQAEAAKAVAKFRAGNVASLQQAFVKALTQFDAAADACVAFGAAPSR